MTENPSKYTPSFLDDRKKRMEFELCKLETRHGAGAYVDCEDVYQVCKGAIKGKLAEIEFDRLCEVADRE